ncbi:acyl carrier protein [Actinomadura keratinilytica]
MTAAVEPETGLWPHLATALRRILHVTEVSPDDDLLEMGLDSMMAVELAAALAAAASTSTRWSSSNTAASASSSPAWRNCPAAARSPEPPCPHPLPP